jgi:hypothetical protein
MYYTIHDCSETAGNEIVKLANIVQRIDKLSGRPGIGSYIMREPMRRRGSAYVAVRRGTDGPYKRGFVVRSHRSRSTAQEACS